MDDDIIPWQKNYENGRYNVYPHDNIVSYVLRSFAAKGGLDRKNLPFLTWELVVETTSSFWSKKDLMHTA